MELSRQYINLDNYEQFTVHTPGCIQPHGVLFVLETEELKILQVSDNTKQFLGIKAKSLLGKSLSSLISPKQIKYLLELVRGNSPEFVTLLTFKNKKKKAKFKGIIHRIQDSLVLELEPLKLFKNHDSIELYTLLKNAITKISIASSFEKLTDNITQEVRKITGFDRVLLYRFEMDGSGVVIAENKREDLESYLGLHYPSFDIPSSVRKFYRNNWLRLIPDVNYESIPIVPRQHPLKQEDLDLSFAVLRSVFPCHIQYLKNMGVQASMSISLMNEGNLWGLVACHHYSPRYVDYETRKVCEFLGQFISVELLYKQEQEFRKYRTQIQGIQSRIRQGLSRNPHLIGNVIKKNQSSLLNLVRAQGAVISLGEQINLIGETPDKGQIKDLIKNFLNQKQTDIFYTDCLPKEYSPAEEYKPLACGILAISIFLSSSTYHIFWLRPEQIHEVEWAGNPDEIIIADAEIPQLCPRNSFAMWKEIIKGKSLPWQPLEIEAAQELRDTLLLAALEFSQFSQSILAEKTRQAKAANLAKSQFLAKMSHELRTPLNAILGFTQMMNRDHSLSSDQQEYLGIINRSGEHLLSLINDVLEMSRIEAGQLNLHQSCFDLHALIQSIRELLTLKAASKGLELTIAQEPDLPQYLEGDEGKLRQIMVNLVGNAIKFTNVGKVLLHLSVFPKNPQSGTITLQLQVKDTGIGIATNELETIFEPFKQTENSLQSKEGTGLGLSISRQFARLIGGDITVESQLHHGSTFTCRIKMMIPQKIEGLVKTESKRIISLQSSQPKYRILVVEDVRDSQLLMVKMLASVGFQVRSANNGQEAIAIWQEWQPHLIWMDMRMPVMDGYQASGEIRQLEAEKPNLQTPVIIIALTATAFDQDRKAILDVGCNDFVSKPFREEIIFKIMAKYLGVRYVYEQVSANSESACLASQFDLKQLQSQLNQMSAEWINQLHQAALSAREKKITQLIKEIPVDNYVLSQSLRQMLKNLAFEQIVNLTERITDE